MTPMTAMLICAPVFLTVFLVLWFLRRSRRKYRDYLPVEAVIVSCETREAPIDQDTVGTAAYWVTLAFEREGRQIHQLYGPLGGPQAPEVGRRIPMRYNPATGQLAPGSSGSGGLLLMILLPILLVVALIALGVSWGGSLQEITHISEPVCFLLGLFFFGGAIKALLDRRAFLTKLRQERLRPVPAVLEGYRQGADSDGDPVHYPIYEYIDQGRLLRMEGSSVASRKLRPGARITLYRNLSTGRVSEEVPRVSLGMLLVLGGLGAVFLAAAFWL